MSIMRVIAGSVRRGVRAIGVSVILVGARLRRGVRGLMRRLDRMCVMIAGFLRVLRRLFLRLRLLRLVGVHLSVRRVSHGLVRVIVGR
jgi:hypothetical protein